MEFPPDYEEPLFSTAHLSPRETLRKLKVNAWILGIFWTLLGAWLLTMVLGTPIWQPERQTAKTIFAVVGLLYVGAGLMTLLRNIWFVRLGLLVCYTLLALTVYSVALKGPRGIPAIVVQLVLILQAHRVLYEAGVLKKLGFPPNVHPSFLG